MDGILPLMLFILLPAVGVAVAALLTLLAFRDARVETGAPAVPAGRPDPAMGRVLIFVVLPTTGPIFGFALYYLAVQAYPSLAGDAVIAIGTCFGMAGLFTALGQGILARVAARDIVRNPANFGRHVVVIAQCEAVVVLAFAIAYLSMSADPPPAGLAMANYIMGVSSIGAVVSGLLVANVDPARMPRRIVRGMAGTGLALVGFLAAFLLLGMA